MPNWVENRLVITGEPKMLEALAQQVSKPYQIDGRTVTGQFLFWNIDKPTNLDAYLMVEQKVVREAQKIVDAVNPNKPEPISMDEIAERLKEGLKNFDPQASFEEFERGVATGMDWWNWNIREWGTKWELGDDTSATMIGDILEYNFQTAWAPPFAALSKLAKQYPMLDFRMYGIDEGDNFAYEGRWTLGEVLMEDDLDITHELHLEFYGTCWACDPDHLEDEWDNYAERRKEFGCPSTEHQ